MSRYKGPRFKKIRRLGTLPGLTSKKPTVGARLKMNKNLYLITHI